MRLAEVQTGIPEIDKECGCNNYEYYEIHRCVAERLEKMIREILEKENTKTIMFYSKAPNDDYSYEVWIFDDKVKFIWGGYATARGKYRYEYTAKSLADIRVYGRLPDLSGLASWVRSKLSIEYVLTVCEDEG
ncbi:MAG: hypothetical protein QXW41_08020 [Fervidicoccaceae archaeon]